MSWPFEYFAPSGEPACYALATGIPESGRRLRVFARLSLRVKKDLAGIGHEEAMRRAEWLRPLVDPLSTIPLRTGSPLTWSAIPSEPTGRAPMHSALQDLAYEINEDLQEACECLGDPGVWFPGVDEGIEPVTDEHVSLVMWAMQRELNRETRYRRLPGSHKTDPEMVKLPAPVLSEFPFRIQRALAERRRLRFQQWGIGREEWERNRWSLWAVPLDPDYRSRREMRGLPETNDAVARWEE